MSHATDVINSILKGRLVPFLGAGVNLCDRPVDPKYRWKVGERLPSGVELARYLAENLGYPVPTDCQGADCPQLDQCDRTDCPIRELVAACPQAAANLDLARVSQYGATLLGPGRLYDELQNVFDREYAVTEVHRFLASLAFAAPSARLASARHLLVVSTNYDDLMERAFRERGQEIDLVFYDPENPDPGGFPRGCFLHQKPGRPPEVIERPNEYDYPFLEERPVLLKIHGTAGRPVVITEDHYIDYLADEAFTKLPKRLISRLCNSHLLFLGYSLRDWNFRVFLRRIKRNRTQDFTSWAVVTRTDEEEPAFWRERARVEILLRDLGEYVSEIRNELAGAMERRNG
jgi:hypothetical protein